MIALKRNNLSPNKKLQGLNLKVELHDDKKGLFL